VNGPRGYAQRMTSVHDFTLKTIRGEPLPLSTYRGKLLLIVNVASKCGLTPQYKGLQALHDQYAEHGLVVLGVPCNQFGAQEPGSEAEIVTFCSTNYGVTFPMASKIEVNGSGRHPLYAFLTQAKTSPDGAGDIKWNFAKFLVNGDGQVIGRFEPKTEPAALPLIQAIEKGLPGR